MDFKSRLAGIAALAPVEPRELHRSLNKARGYGKLWDVQAQVLENWETRRDERDLVIKANTGAGKTVVGLIILKSHLNAGNGPALYVAPEPFLVGQVMREAENLDIAVTDDPEDAAYLAGRAIAVVNMHKLVNGRTVFSVERPSRPMVPIGVALVDDVHAALSISRAQLSISLASDSAAFAELLELFEDDLAAQSPGLLLDVTERSFGALVRVPFWAWRARQADVLTILMRHRKSDALHYNLPAVREVLPLCRAVFTGAALTITPPCPSIERVTAFAEATHRVYLTATLADDSVLVTDFAADADSVRNPITPSTAGDIGERMILAPQELNPGLDVGDVRAVVAGLAAEYNVVVLVPSNRAAAAWAAHTPTVVHAADIEDVVSLLRGGHVGLVVFVNKYDGVDLPDDACRVLVVDGLPEISNGEERVETALLRQYGVDDRQIQRIEQGMGRGVRSNEDHCVVFLLGNRLGQLVADPRTFAKFGPATRAQLEQSQSMAQDLGGRSMPEIVGVARQALRRDLGWINYAKSALVGVPAPTGHVADSAVARRDAYDAAVRGDHRDAAQILHRAVEADPSPRVQGWLTEQQAGYVDQLDPAEAQRLLGVARRLNPAVLKPLSGVTYERLPQETVDQGRLAADFLRRTYHDAQEVRLGLQAVVDDLVFDNERTEETEEAIRAVGLHLGFRAERPEKELGEGPDVLWSLGGGVYWVIEAKTGATNPLIYKRDANQLTGSVTWFSNEYDQTSHAVPVMVHDGRKLHREASFAPEVKVMTKTDVARLKAALLGYATGLAGTTLWADPGTVAGLLAGHALTATDVAGYLSGHEPA